METLTFLFTDIEGSTALLGRLGDDDYQQLLAGHQALVRSALAAHDGREVDTQGGCVLRRVLLTAGLPGGGGGDAAGHCGACLAGRGAGPGADGHPLRRGGERLLSQSLAALCGACFFAGEPEAGRPFGQESAERARRLGDNVLLGRSLLAYLLTIDPAQSGQLSGEAIACTERSGDHLTNLSLHNNASGRAMQAGDIPAARVHLEAAAQAGQQIGFQSPIVMAGMGWARRLEGDLNGAWSMFESALRMSRRSGDSRGTAHACLGLALVVGDLGQWDRSGALHGAAQALLDRTGVAWDEDDARDRRDSLDQARAYLGDEQLERAYARGMTLSVEKGPDLVLPMAGPGRSPPSPGPVRS